MLTDHQLQMKGGFREMIYVLHFSRLFLIWRVSPGTGEECAFNINSYPTFKWRNNVTFNWPKASHHKVTLASLPHLTQIVLVKSGCLFLPWSGEDCDLGTHIHQSHKSLILSLPLNPPAYLEGGVWSLVPLRVMEILAPP